MKVQEQAVAAASGPVAFKLRTEVTSGGGCWVGGARGSHQGARNVHHLDAVVVTQACTRAKICQAVLLRFVIVCVSHLSKRAREGNGHLLSACCLLGTG